MSARSRIEIDKNILTIEVEDLQFNTIFATLSKIARLLHKVLIAHSPLDSL